MKRKIIQIDEERCNGCALCIPNCPEGAIQVIDGKARLVGDLLCDGLGACLGHCPEGAITVEEREAEAYDERRVMENVARQGRGVVRAHLEHLKSHGQQEYLKQALDWLEEQGLEGEAGPTAPRVQPPVFAGCPGSRSLHFANSDSPAATPAAEAAPAAVGELTHWPVQLHLVSPQAPQYRGADVVLSADCVAYAVGDFHRRFLRGKALAIACPKLDEGQEIYLDKLQALVEGAGINTLTVLTMEVPCCGGLVRLAREALARSARKVPLKHVIVGLQGQVLQEDWE